MGEMSSAEGPGFLQIDRGEGVVFLTLTEPAEGLGQAELEQLAGALTEASRAPELAGLVLVLRGGHRQSADMAQRLAEVCNRIEAFALPVVAVLPGGVGGSVWALALAAHYRIGVAKTQAVLSEARFGNLPGAGVTQRQARLAGAAQTLRMILGTRPESAPALLEVGLLDELAQADPIEAALRLIQRDPPLRRSRDATRGFKDPSQFLAEVRAQTEQAADDPLDVVRAAAKAVEAALLLPFANGLAMEAVLQEDLAAAPATRALAHAQRAEAHARHRLRQLAEAVRPLPAPRLRRLGLWRGGPARAGLVAQALMSGLEVVLADPAEAGLAALGARVLQVLEAEPLLGAEERGALAMKLSLVEQASALSRCDLVLSGDGDLPALGVPVAMLGHWPGHWAAWVSLLVPRRGSDHAEIGVPERAEALPSVPLVLDLARRLRWRLQMVGPDGFIEPALRKAMQLVSARLAEMGHKGAVLTAGMARAGIGTSRYLPGQKVQPQVEEVATLALAALANEGTRLLEEGIAPSALDVDAAAMAGGLMARWAGGPMHQGELRGLILLRSDLQRLGGEGRLAPSAYLDDTIAAGGHLLPRG